MMKSIRRVAPGVALWLACLSQPAAAADPFLTNPVTPLIYPYLPLCPGSHGVSLATAIGLTPPTGVAAGNSCVTKAVKANYAVVCARTATVYYTLDGSTTPTTNNSTILAVGACVPLFNSFVIANFMAISASGTVDVEYFQ